MLGSTSKSFVVLHVVKQVQVSIRRIQFEKAWETVQDMQTTDAVFEGPVIGVNRGGAIVLVEVSAFYYRYLFGHFFSRISRIPHTHGHKS